MNLEIKIQRIFDKELMPLNVYHCKFSHTGGPMSLDKISKIDREMIIPTLQVDLLIDCATKEECELSNSDYIKNMKRWLKNNNLQEAWSKKYREIFSKECIIGRCESNNRSVFATVGSQTYTLVVPIENFCNIEDYREDFEEDDDEDSYF